MIENVTPNPYVRARKAARKRGGNIIDLLVKPSLTRPPDSVEDALRHTAAVLVVTGRTGEFVLTQVEQIAGKAV